MLLLTFDISKPLYELVLCHAAVPHIPNDTVINSSNIGSFSVSFLSYMLFDIDYQLCFLIRHLSLVM